MKQNWSDDRLWVTSTQQEHNYGKFFLWAHCQRIIEFEEKLENECSTALFCKVLCLYFTAYSGNT